jgi:hypothetical protein
MFYNKSQRSQTSTRAVTAQISMIKHKYTQILWCFISVQEKHADSIQGPIGFNTRLLPEFAGLLLEFVLPPETDINS